MATRTLPARIAGETTATVSFDKALISRIAAHAVALKQAEAKRVGEAWMEETTQWMKENAPWKDETGNARASLGVIATYSPGHNRYLLTGGVSYMKHLELNNAGRYAILGDATHIWGHVLLGRLGAQRV